MREAATSLNGGTTTREDERLFTY